MRARCFVTKRQSDDDSQPASLREVPLSLDTLWVDMDQEKLAIVCRGRTPVRSVKLRDIEILLVLLEPLDEPDHPLAHYEAMFVQEPVVAEAPPAMARERFDFAAMKADLEAKVEEVKKEIAEVEKVAQQAMNGPLMAKLKATGHVPPPPQGFEAAVAAAKQSGDKQLARLLKSLQNTPRATAEQIETAKKASSLFSQGIADVLALPGKVATLQADFDAKIAAAFPPKKVIDRTAFDGEGARRDGFAKNKLRGADFSGLDLSGISFAGASLQEAKFTNAKLCGADLAGANLCVADLSGADLTGARLDSADLHKAIVAGTVWKQASLTQAKLSGLDLTGADFSGATGTRPDFTEAILARATFCKAQLPQAVFRKAVLTEADFTHTHLQDADLSFAKATGIRMADSDLSRLRAGHGADFSNADLKRIKADGSIWKGSNLAKANFQQASLVRARFPEARLPEVIFDRCDLAYGVFEDAQLRGAVLTNANLLRVAFDRADLTDACLENANLYEAGFWDAVLLRRAPRPPSRSLSRLAGESDDVFIGSHCRRRDDAPLQEAGRSPDRRQAAARQRHAQRDGSVGLRSVAHQLHEVCVYQGDFSRGLLRRCEVLAVALPGMPDGGRPRRRRDAASVSAGAMRPRGRELCRRQSRSKRIHRLQSRAGRLFQLHDDVGHARRMQGRRSSAARSKDAPRGTRGE
jgi:uncharacterized protein YjbI with pentapeptide repeats/ferritin-like metal-binding protein YciE